MNVDELTTNLIRNNVPIPIPKQNLRVKTWFMEREDGQVLAADEESAWFMLKPSQRSDFQKPKYKIIGVSFANAYATAVEKLTGNLEEKKAQLREAFNASVEEARGNIERPRNPNIRDSEGRIQSDRRILDNLPR